MNPPDTKELKEGNTMEQMGNATATQFFAQSRSGRIWEILIKAAVPVSILLAGGMIKNEVTDALQSERIETLQDKVKSTAPGSISDDVRRLLQVSATISDRLTRIETKIEQLEKVRN